MQWRQTDGNPRPMPWARSCLFTLLPGTLLATLGVLVLALLLIKLLWAWTVPDLFPGAVQQKLIVESISWTAAFKLAIFIAVLAAVAGVRRSRN